jgi:hypothetical protein
MDRLTWRPGWFGRAAGQGALILYSVISVAVMIERALTLKRVRRVEESEYTNLRSALMHGGSTKPKH